MPPLPPLVWRLLRGGRNGLQRLLVDQPARGVAVGTVLVVVWALVAGLGLLVLAFLDQDQYLPLKPRLVESLLGLLFFALFFLVSLSNTIVVWTALFRSPAGIFQAQLPLGPRALYWGAGIEGAAWSSWAGIVLGLPLIAVLAREAAQPWLYLPLASGVLIAFLAVCMALGCCGAIIVAGIIPLLRRSMRALLAVAVLMVVSVTLLGLSRLETGVRPLNFMREAIGSIAFTETPYLPPAWAQRALAAAIASRWDEALWHGGLLLSTAVTLALAGEWLAGARLRRLLDALVARGDQARRRQRRQAAWTPSPLLGHDLGLLVAKDLRLFARDPAQVLQFALYFGMLAFYILLLPRIERTFRYDDWWRPLVSLLNLTAVSMALATFTGRFVFPLLSYEGKRLWILALAPWPRHRVVTAKFAFALVVGMPVSVVLVVLSGSLLELPQRVVAFQALVTVCMACGLSAGALGLGALLADYREDNPAKLAAGYGGTINLLLSLVLVGVLLVAAAAPMVAWRWPWVWPLALVAILVITIAWTWAGLTLAHHAFDRGDDRT